MDQRPDSSEEPRARPQGDALEDSSRWYRRGRDGGDPPSAAWDPIRASARSGDVFSAVLSLALEEIAHSMAGDPSARAWRHAWATAMKRLDFDAADRAFALGLLHDFERRWAALVPVEVLS